MNCEACGAELLGRGRGRPRRFCSSACRQRAYRTRRGPAERLGPKPYLTGEGWALHAGDAAAVLRELPAGTAQCAVTSPPYLGLRDYRGHPDQIGQEPTVDAYVQALTRVAHELARVLRPDGCLWLNLGDAYAGRADATPKRHAGRGHRAGITAPRVNTTRSARYKSLLMLPQRVALALQADGWIVRNAIVWHKPNAMPESVTDRLSCRYEHLYLLTRSPRYYFDLDAIRVAATGREPGNKGRDRYADPFGNAASSRRYLATNPGSTLSQGSTTRNPGDVWTIATRPSAAPHFAMFPIDIPLRCVAASSRPCDLVLDPFAGMSTTGRAALTLGRRYLGIDVNTDYHDAAAPILSAQLPVAG